MLAIKFLVLSVALCMPAVKAWATQSYKSVPFITPVFNVIKSGRALAPGYLFLTTTGSPYPASIIVTDEGELVWASESGRYGNLNVQTLNSKPVLTYWNGTGSPDTRTAGHGYGSVHILDSTYTHQHDLCLDLDLAADGPTRSACQADVHESYITERGTLLVTAYNSTLADLTSVGGPAQGWIYDSLVFEVDIKTKKVVFSWSALKAGIPISESKQSLGASGTEARPFDYFHINSIQSVGRDYLINSRNTWTTYLISSKGGVKWRFDGSTGGDFKLPPGSHFAWQHQSRALKVTHRSLVLHLFNNANSQPPYSGVNQTLGQIFSLDLKKKTSTLLQDYADPKQALYAESQGAFNLLPNGNRLMGYGQIPVVKEYGPRGDVRLSVQFGDLAGAQQSYRAYRLEWKGVPAADPDVFAEKGHVYASWNGATGVNKWDIYEGTTQHNVKYSHSVRKAGFETKASISRHTRYVKVSAVTSDWKQRSSATVPVLDTDREEFLNQIP